MDEFLFPDLYLFIFWVVQSNNAAINSNPTPTHPHHWDVGYSVCVWGGGGIGGFTLLVFIGM